MKIQSGETREKLIVAAIAEMQEHGIYDFSIRRVAERCEVSSGAPYKHFKSKSDLVLESIRYINRKWGDVQYEVIKKCGKDPRQRLVEISIAYVRFLCSNPAYTSVLMLSDNSLEPEQLTEKAMISTRTENIITDYCNSVGMNDRDRIRKTYAVRSFILGAAYMINSGVFEDNEKSIELARYCIERDFDLD